MWVLHKPPCRSQQGAGGGARPPPGAGAGEGVRAVLVRVMGVGSILTSIDNALGVPPSSSTPRHPRMGHGIRYKSGHWIPQQSVKEK